MAKHFLKDLSKKKGKDKYKSRVVGSNQDLMRQQILTLPAIFLSFSLYVLANSL